MKIRSTPIAFLSTALRRPGLLRLLLALCITFGTTAVFGQTAYTWTGAANGTNLSTAGNWTTNGVDPATTLPNGNNGLGDGFQDSAMWDGKTSTNLLLIYNTTWPNTGFGSVGVNLTLTANQLNDVQITTTLPTSAGVGVNHVTNNSPSAAFTMGDSGANNWLVFGRPAGAIHYYVNNSTAPATINPSVKFQAGGGNGYTYQFGGTGNWIVNSHLMPDNNAFSPSMITVDGPGTVYWYGGRAGGYNPNSPLGQITVNGGSLVIKTNGLFTGTANQAIVNNATFVYDGTGAQNLSGVISGTGTLVVSNGTLILSGQSTYSGTTLLGGGTLVVNGAETDQVSGPLGFGGNISFSGGALQFSVNNVYDYSGRFSAAAGQAYRIDTGGQNVTLTNNLASSGGTLTKLGNGTLTLAGTSSYSGLTTVSGGRLVFQGSKTGTGNVTVADSATLGVTATGTQVTPATLTTGVGSGVGFNNVNSTTTAVLAVGAIAAAGPITINVNSGTFTPGNSYPLLSWTSGSAPAVTLGVLNGFIGNLSTNGSTIQLNITATAFKWTGITDGNWDLTTANNWQQNGGPVLFANGGPVLFDDSTTRTNVTINALVQPSTVTVNTTNPYSFASSGGNNLGGSASLNKSGSGALILSGGANTYTGVTTIDEGVVSVGVLANGGVASDIGSSSSSAASLVFNGGTLQYTGAGVSSDRSFTLNTTGGTIDGSGTGDLTLNNAGALGYGGNGPRTLTLTGSGTSNTLAAPLANNGGATALSKSGSGKWVLTGNHTYSGVTTINGGELQVGNGGANGTLGSGNVINNGGLGFNRTGSLTVSGAISGGGSVSNFGSGTVILTGSSTYGGGTVIAANSTLQVGNGGATGALPANGGIVNDGTLIFNLTAQPPDIFSIISGTGSLIKRGSGTVRIFAAQTYTGNTTIEAGTLQPTTGNVGALATPQIAISNNATLLLVRQDAGAFIYAGNIIGEGRVVKDVNNDNVGDVTFTGTNTYTGGTWIAGGGVILGDSVNPQAGSITGNVIFTNSLINNSVTRSITFNRPDDFTFAGNIINATTGANAGSRGSVTHNGSGTVTLTGNNTYVDGTTISFGTLQVGNGGTSGTIGTGNVTANGPLIFNRSDSLTYGGNISGGAVVSQSGSGTLTLTSTNYSGYFGNLTVSNGTLAISGFTAPNTTNTLFGGLDVNGGTLTVGGVGSVSVLELSLPLNVNGGTIVASLNTALTPSNTFYSVNAGVAVTSGTLKLINAGPQLVVGQKFTIFSQPVTGLTIVSPGLTVQNNLATDGSVTVTAVQPAPTITASVVGNQLNLSWPATWTGGVHVQAQTNNLATGLSNNWVTIPGTDAANTYSATIDPTKGAVFYRLIAP
ncbi:MAG TPA: autotransporter-associated beta strand repeat-containing protein [Verrucomicrobiae bacterium]|nr:autotransporter-associated beta strand repeat-containing protein [Verrucomicrobiae bacterium]